ncbi:hypothetical protein [Sphingomonas sp.]
MRAPSGLQTAMSSAKNYQLFVVIPLAQDNAAGGVIMAVNRPTAR